MTPQEYLKIEEEQAKIIAEANLKISTARQNADKASLPDNLRPATAEDVKPGAVIWYKHFDEGVPAWMIVLQVLNPNDEYKAFVAEDGCRYGLEGAYVEEEYSSPAIVSTPVIEPDHPEATCKKCGGKNTLWYAPNEIWNSVMRDTDHLEDDWGIICPQCFLELTEAKGLKLIFTVEAIKGAI